MTDGICQCCGEIVASAAATRHVRRCHTDHMPAGAPTVQAAHLVVTDRYCPDYWLHLLVPTAHTLYDLDDYFRAIWVECCDHMSEFRTKTAVYDAEPLDEGPAAGPMPADLRAAFERLGLDPAALEGGLRQPENHDMGVTVGEALPKGCRAVYTYDFGSSTELDVVTKAVVELPMRAPADIVLLARNNPPERLCVTCGKPAVEVCACCVYDGGWLCASCAPEHECGEEMLLPLVNSPRTGVCGYVGPAEAPRSLFDDEVPVADQPLFTAAALRLAAYCVDDLADYAGQAHGYLLRAACDGALARTAAPAEAWAAAAIGTVARVWSSDNPYWPKGLTAGKIADRLGVPRPLATRLIKVIEAAGCGAECAV